MMADSAARTDPADRAVPGPRRPARIGPSGNGRERRLPCRGGLRSAGLRPRRRGHDKAGHLPVPGCRPCGALVADVNGPVHAYVPSAPGCWAAFGELQADELQRFGRHPAHDLVVDAYMAQHPGQVLTHRALLHAVWGTNADQPEYLRVTIGQLLPAGLSQYVPGTALQAAVTVNPSAGLLAPGAAVVVLAVYAAIALAAASIRISHRDA